MSALGETQARITSVRQLRTVVGAMRGIAASHTQQARLGLDGYRAYARVVAEELGRALQLIERGSEMRASTTMGSVAVVAFTAEHGFAGAFGDRVLAAVSPGAKTELFIVGSRGLALAEQRGWQVDWTAPMASQVSGVTATARVVSDALYSRFVRKPFAGAEIVYAKVTATTELEVVRRRLLPIDLAVFAAHHSGAPPLVNLPPGRLVEQLVGEYVFAELALAALESFASENAARLVTMELARINIDHKAEELSGLERLLRQEQVTAEVQELTSSALALEGVDLPADRIDADRRNASLRQINRWSREPRARLRPLSRA